MNQTDTIQERRPEVASKKQINSKRKKIVFMTELAMLTAIVIIMAFTPLGYLRTPAFQITFIVVPIAVGAVVLGWKAGLWLGLVFGVTSILQPEGLALLALIPVQGIVTAIVPRLLAGLVPALAYAGLSKVIKKREISVSIACLLAPITNTIFYLGFFVVCLGSFMADYSPDVYGFFAEKGFFASYGTVLALASVNAIVEALSCLLIASAVSNALLHTLNKGN